MVSESEKIDPKSLLSPSLILYWIIIFLIALVSRLFFLNFSRQLPVFWDARLYTAAALGILGYFDRDEPFGKGDNDDKDFTQYYTRYLNGEDIQWLYYKVPSLAESQKYIFYSGPVYPVVLALIFSLDWERDFQVVRHFNAILDALAIVILTMLLFMLWGRAPAVIGAILQLLYVPSILTCGVLALETITTFLIVLFLFLVGIYYLTEKKWAMVICGAVGGLMVLTKPTASLLTLPLLGFFLIIYFKRWKMVIRSAVLYFIPFVILVIPWIVFTSAYYGQLALRDPEYSVANFRASSSIDFEGYDLDYSDPDFWSYSVTDHVLNDPIGYANLLSKKIIRMWWMPHDEFWQGPEWLELTYHRLLMILALLAMAAIPLMRQRFLLLPTLIVAYYAGIHLILHALPRYNFNALPAIFILVPVFIFFVIENMRRSQDLRKALILSLALGLIVVIINGEIVSRMAVAYAGKVVPSIVVTLLILAAGYLYVRKFRYLGGWKGSGHWLWAPFLLICLTSITGWSRPHLKEWYTPLRDGKTRLVTEIHLPPDTVFAENDMIKLVIDMTTAPDCTAPVEVVINGLFIQLRDDQSPANQAFYSKGTYRVFHGIMGFDLRTRRWYRTIGLDPEKLNKIMRPDGILAVAISFGEDIDIGGGLKLYGDSFGPEEDSISLPSFSHRSIERFRELGDRRIYENYLLKSTPSFSYIFSDSGIESDDLSPYPKRQRGRYRVYLLIKHADFQIEHF